MRQPLAIFLFSLLGAAAVSAGGICGNGVVEADEECDDGGLLDLDGCTRACRYEQIQRVTSLALEGGSAPAFCDPTTNQLGGAFTALGLPVFNTTLQNGIEGGLLHLLFDFLALDDPAGQNDPSLELGLLSGEVDPDDPSPGGLDAWYLVGGGGLDADGLPASRITPGSITALELAAGPSDLVVPFVGGELAMLGARLEALIGGDTSLPGPPPSELAPGFLAFETSDATGTDDGLCGNVTVGALAAIPVPDEVTVGGAPCRSDCPASRAYVSCGGAPVNDSCHSLLDLLVGGCRITTGLCLPVIVPTQPDVGVGGNPPLTLLFEPTGTGIDKVTVVEPDDAYSSWFELTSQRVHVTDNLGVVFRDGFESGDPSAWE